MRYKFFIVLVFFINATVGVCVSQPLVRSTVGCQEYQRIGYTTKYGNSFGQTTNNYQIYYNNGYHNHSYTSVYTPGANRGSKGGGGPRKSAQRPFSGNFLEDFADWMRMNIDPNWPGYVDPDYWDEFLEEYPEYADEAEQWFNDHGQTPPWQTPIGEPDGLFYMLYFYAVYKVVKTKIVNCVKRVKKSLFSKWEL